MAERLTGKDLDDAKRLKAAWIARKDFLGLTQEKAGAAIGMTQGAVAQYLNGHTALNVGTKVKFASVLQMSPQAIWPDFEFTVPAAASEHAELLAAIERQLQALTGSELDEMIAALRFVARRRD